MGGLEPPPPPPGYATGLSYALPRLTIAPSQFFLLRYQQVLISIGLLLHILIPLKTEKNTYFVEFKTRLDFDFPDTL